LIFFAEKNHGVKVELLVSSAWCEVEWNGGATAAMVVLGNLQGKGKEGKRMTRIEWRCCRGTEE
jgi:hypothetical protein